MSPARRKPVLLLGFGDAFDPLAGRLLLLNLRALRADWAADAVGLVERSAEPVRAGLLPAEHSFRDLRHDLDRLRSIAPGIEFVVIGQRPDAAGIDALRKAGVRLCLWEGADESALRFVLNQALFDPTRGNQRTELRVPTGMIARVFAASGEKAALVYNLSLGGAFLETHRPTMSGGHVKVEIPLPGNKLTLPARVVSTNVPGNLQRPNLPLGMGVEFVDLAPEARASLERYIADRAAQFRL
jgi:hypothetical protein